MNHRRIFRDLLCLLAAMPLCVAGAQAAPSKTPLTDKLVEQVRPLNDTQAEAQYLNGWIASSIGLQGGSEGAQNDVEYKLGTLNAACAAREMMFSEILTRLGIQTRRISFFDIPIQIGHTAVEVKIGAHWKFFDPATGIYFTHLGDTEPLSISAARKAYPRISVWRAKEPLYTGIWGTAKKFEYVPYTDNYIYNPLDHAPMVDIVRTYFASRMSGAPEQIVNFTELIFDVRNPERGWREWLIEKLGGEIAQQWQFGAVDQSGMDLLEYTNPAGIKLYRPMLERLGAYDAATTGRSFLFLTDTPKRIRLTINTVRGVGGLISDLNHSAYHFSKSETQIYHTATDQTQRFEFTIFPPHSRFKVWMTGPGDFMEVDSYRWQVIDDAD